ncbi:carboxymuconolactone decarboxylase family protein [Mycolicibacterium fortuitum]
MADAAIRRLSLAEEQSSVVDRPAAGSRKRTYSVPQFLDDALMLVGRGPNVARAWREQTIDPLLREKVMLAVAAVNQSRLSAFVHSELALERGATRAELAQLSGLDGITAFDAELVAVAWARSRAEARLGSASSHLRQALRKHYSPLQRADLDTVVRVATLISRAGNTLEAGLERLRGRPAADNRMVDEVIVGGCYLAGALLVGLLLALQRRVSPLRIVKRFRRFRSELASVHVIH